MWTDKVINWFLGLFSSTAVKNMLSAAITMEPYVLPVVQIINIELKPGLKDTKQQNKDVILAFLTKNCPDLNDIEHTAEQLSHLPYHLIVKEIATLWARKICPKEPLSTVELAILLAYNIYKVTRK